MYSVSREESVDVLEKMRVHIPPTSKLSNDAVEQRLKKALSASQIIHLPGDNTDTDVFNVDAYPIWPGSINVLGAVRTSLFHIEERFSLATMLKFVPTDTDDPQRDTFVELRRFFMILATGWEEGTKCIMVQDGKANELTTYMRMVEVREISRETPAIIVIYKTMTGSNVPKGWAAEKRNGNERVQRVLATDLEHKLLLKLLFMNTKHVSSVSDTNPSSTPDDADGNARGRTPAERGFKISALFPVGPLPFEAIGRLNSDEGCAVCGETKASKCSDCHLVSYCSPVCQETDWTTHREQCHSQSVKTAGWYKVTYTQMPFMTSMNRFGHRSGPLDRTMTPDDFAEDSMDKKKVFPIKLQLGDPYSRTPNMMIYDQKKTFTGIWEKKQQRDSVEDGEEDEEETFEKFVEEMKKYVPKYGGWKMYRFAKRTGREELSVCLDREPPDLVW